QINDIIKGIKEDALASMTSMQEVKDEVKHGVQLIIQSGDMFGGILQAIANISEQVQDLSSATEEMSAGTQEVSASIAEMAHLAKQSSQQSQTIVSHTKEQLYAMEAIDKSVISLSETAEALQSVVGRFKV
ncbi:MAG: methyl-accepting chemotaxis protein, partial [Paenibacillus sp.]|nr:methyl-accepting chemotaxis protein [Paenibacillus sp.]